MDENNVEEVKKEEEVQPELPLEATDVESPEAAEVAEVTPEEEEKLVD